MVILHSPGAHPFHWRTFPQALRVVRNHDLLQGPNDARAVRGAEIVLTTSPRYARRGGVAGATTRYLPNSSEDFGHARGSKDVSKDSNIRGVVGTMGTFSFPTDYPLLAEVTRRSHDLRFVFQGSFWDEHGRDMLRSDNVEIMERNDCDPRAVTSFLRRVQVGICPYRRTEWTLHIAPTRLLAFLSAGLPVVTTNFSPETLEVFRDLPGVFVAADARGFSRALYEAIEATTDPTLVQGLKESAKPFLASAVAERFQALVQDALSSRRAPSGAT